MANTNWLDDPNKDDREQVHKLIGHTYKHLRSGIHSVEITNTTVDKDTAISLITASTQYTRLTRESVYDFKSENVTSIIRNQCFILQRLCRNVLLPEMSGMSSAPRLHGRLQDRMRPFKLGVPRMGAQLRAARPWNCFESAY